MVIESIENCMRCGKKLNSPQEFDTDKKRITCFECFEKNKNERRYPNQMRYGKINLEDWK